ncbi:MAG: GAF domain-containing protein [Polyangiaceae bacterium]
MTPRAAAREALRRVEARAKDSGDAAFTADVALLAAALDGDAPPPLSSDPAHVEQRLRRNHQAIMTLARSESLSRGALDESLREITETASKILGVERSSVWVYNADQSAILCLELFQRSTGEHQSGIELPKASFPAYFDALKEERAIAANDALTDPRTREFSETYLRPLDIRSMLDAPIRVGGRMIGVICNEQVGAARAWSIDEEQFAGSLADFIALAMESSQRRETEQQLRTMLQDYEEALPLAASTIGDPEG